MVVFYTDVVDKIMSGVKNSYTRKHCEKLGQWALNDPRTEAAIDEERNNKLFSK